jgi:hypothetical protein
MSTRPLRFKNLDVGLLNSHHNTRFNEKQFRSQKNQLDGPVIQKLTPIRGVFKGCDRCVSSLDSCSFFSNSREEKKEPARPDQLVNSISTVSIGQMAYPFSHCKGA